MSSSSWTTVRRACQAKPSAARSPALPPFPAEIAAHLCRLTLMRLLPAVAEADLDAAGPAVAEMQRRVGDHFAPAQGGRFTSPAVARVLAWLEAEGIPGVGQSSWGPTGFALLPDAVTAERVKAAAERALRGGAGPELRRHCAGATAGPTSAGLSAPGFAGPPLGA